MRNILPSIFFYVTGTLGNPLSSSITVTTSNIPVSKLRNVRFYFILFLSTLCSSRAPKVRVEYADSAKNATSRRTNGCQQTTPTSAEPATSCFRNCRPLLADETQPSTQLCAAAVTKCFLFQFFFSWCNYYSSTEFL